MKKKIEDTFGNNFKKLEEILVNLESGIEDHSLEEIIKNYQDGINLINICRKKLDEAELKIEKISTEQDN
ncbi:MAG TPA: exodeoxyribonuclease VII small subunit [Ignavibacteria bacterium]|nr:exodeoxyribonuclease VII small subunit [Ignavibacteria bacterium]HQY52139.1 exodeoxyribonuclease VII small subunit [Ignavibacteria bacterium]HRA99825.1 exodeoxyribonuclease VII small subunit [Ignavibacteria bacterium]